MLLNWTIGVLRLVRPNVAVSKRPLRGTESHRTDRARTGGPTLLGPEDTRLVRPTQSSGASPLGTPLVSKCSHYVLWTLANAHAGAEPAPSEGTRRPVVPPLRRICVFAKLATRSPVPLCSNPIMYAGCCWSVSGPTGRRSSVSPPFCLDSRAPERGGSDLFFPSLAKLARSSSLRSDQTTRQSSDLTTFGVICLCQTAF
jgi:hypothetical protein